MRSELPQNVPRAFLVGEQVGALERGAELGVMMRKSNRALCRAKKHHYVHEKPCWGKSMELQRGKHART